MKTLFLAIVIALITCTSFAEKLVIVGHGATSCGRWLKVTKSEEPVGIANRVSMVSWIQGYLSGINSARATEKRALWSLPDFDSLTAYMDKSCADDPLRNLLAVAMRIEFSLEGTE